MFKNLSSRPAKAQTGPENLNLSVIFASLGMSSTKFHPVNKLPPPKKPKPTSRRSTKKNAKLTALFSCSPTGGVVAEPFPEALHGKIAIPSTPRLEVLLHWSYGIARFKECTNIHLTLKKRGKHRKKISFG